MLLQYGTLKTALFGTIYIVSDGEHIYDISLSEIDWNKTISRYNVRRDQDLPIIKECAIQLIEYLDGKRKEFNLPVKYSGTDFQQKVWTELQNIPYGKTCSYKDIAVAINNEKAVRAVGQANRANPIPIIIPCHRVIGKNNTLTGYAGNRTDLKEKLLMIEGSYKK